MARMSVPRLGRPCITKYHYEVIKEVSLRDGEPEWRLWHPPQSLRSGGYFSGIPTWEAENQASSPSTQHRRPPTQTLRSTRV